MPRVTAVYQQAGAIAVVRSEFFDDDVTIDALIRWANDFEELDIELVRFEIDLLPKLETRHEHRSVRSPPEDRSTLDTGRMR